MDDREILSESINVRVTPTEKAEIEEQAELAGLSRGAYMRKRTLGRPVIASADINLFRELRRLGGLLKHIHTESNGAYSAETAKLLNEISAYITKLANDR
jgi:hypothetical protein